jgi:hypothetical protein
LARPLTAEIAVEAAAVVKNRRRDTRMRTVMEILRFGNGAEDAGQFPQYADEDATGL